MARDQWSIDDADDEFPTAMLDEHVTVAGSDEGLASLQAVAVLGFLDFYLAFTIQPLGEGARETLRHVLHNHDRGAVGGQGGEENTQRFRSAGRGANGNHSRRSRSRAGYAFAMRDGIDIEAK